MSEQQVIEEMQEETCPEAEAPTPQEALEESAVERLARELAELRALVESGRSEAKPTVRQMLTDPFRALYPDVAEQDVPDEVWEDVQNGIPLEAAFALWERRETVRRLAAEEANRKNATGAWGRADTASEQFLSPDEVRSMTQDEVRKQYSRIVESMKHWN